MSDTTNKPTLIDKIYDRLPEGIKDAAYKWATNREVERINNGGPERANAITRSVAYGDAAATAQNLVDLNKVESERQASLQATATKLEGVKTNTSQGARDIMRRGFLQHEAARLGKISGEVQTVLQQNPKKPSRGERQAHMQRYMIRVVQLGNQERESQRQERGQEQEQHQPRGQKR